MTKWTWLAAISLTACGDKPSTSTTDTVTTETDTDTDADSDADTDADTDHDSGTTTPGANASGVWTGTCEPAASGTGGSLDWEMSLTDVSGDVTGNGRITGAVGFTVTATTSTGYGYTTPTTTYGYYGGYGSYGYGYGYGYTGYGGYGSYYYGYTYGGYGYYTTYTYGYYGYGYTEPEPEAIPLAGTFDGSNIDLEVDLGYGSQNPHLVGVIVVDDWTGTYTWPGGQLPDMDCAFVR